MTPPKNNFEFFKKTEIDVNFIGNNMSEAKHDGGADIVDEYERLRALANRFLNQVETNIAQNKGILSQAASVARVSMVLQELYQLDDRSLKPARLRGFNLEFTPPVDIPVYALNDQNALRDETLALAHAVIGRRVDEYNRPRSLHPVSLEQLAAGDVRGAFEFSSAIRSMSTIGHYLFTDLDEFDENRGAMVQGRPMNQVGKIDIQAAGASVMLIRPR